MKTDGNRNCWEFMGCGMDHAFECPAYPLGGRICYMLAGTICNGEPHKNYAQKSHDCVKCNFYREEILKSLPGTRQTEPGTA